MPDGRILTIGSECFRLFKALLPAGFICGFILAPLNTFMEIVIAKEEFDEAGPSIIYHKCFCLIFIFNRTFPFILFCSTMFLFYTGFLLVIW